MKIKRFIGKKLMRIFDNLSLIVFSIAMRELEKNGFEKCNKLKVSRLTDASAKFLYISNKIFEITIS